MDGEDGESDDHRSLLAKQMLEDQERYLKARGGAEMRRDANENAAFQLCLLTRCMLACFSGRSVR